MENQHPVSNKPKDKHKKAWKKPRLIQLNIKETKGGLFDFNWESPDWIPLSHS